MAFNPPVDKEKCKGCEECADIFTVDVFEIHNGKAVPVNAEKCFS
jgi:NAD-dependent dihydropyrimidine dehydrogenase PreA subunit